MKTLIITVMILLTVTIVYDLEATTYYVDFDGGDDSNNGTSTSTPWLNLPGTCTTASSNVFPCTDVTNSWTQIRAGDTIKIKSGTTHDSSDGGRIHIDFDNYDNGTSGAVITIKRDQNWGTGDVIIDMTGVSVRQYYAAISVYEVTYITIDGVTDNGIVIRGSEENGLFIYSDSGINLRNLEIHNSDVINVKIVSTNRGTFMEDITLYNLRVHDTNTTGDAGSNIMIRFADGFLIDSCTVYDGGGDGIHLGSCKNGWIINNTVYNNGVGAEQGIDISKEPGFKEYDNSYNVTVRDNISYDNYKMNFDHNSGVYNVYYINNVGRHTRTTQRFDGNFHVYEGTAGANFWINNTATKGRDWGFSAVWSDNPWSIPNGTYQQYYINNISSENGDGVKSGQSCFIANDYGSMVFSTNYYNNNFHSSRGTTVVQDRGILYTADNINTGTGAWPGTDCISSDPLFVANGSTWETTDLNLTSSSPSKDTGVFPFTTSSSGSGATVTLNRLVADLDARRVFRTGDTIKIEDCGIFTVSSVDSATQITLASSASWASAKGVWFEWFGSAPDMGAYEYIPSGTTPDDNTPPADITNFTATTGNSQITLNWTNPSDDDYVGTMIRYRIDGTYPIDHNDGILVSNKTAAPGSSDNFTHIGLQNGTTYFYSALTYDGVPNYSEAVQVSTVPTAAPTYLNKWIEAETKTPNQPLVITTEEDADACCDKYIESSGPGGEISYTISIVESGNYDIWLRVKNPNLQSFSVSIGGENTTYDIQTVNNTWTWVKVKGKDYLTNISHDLLIGNWVGGTKLDKILITNNDTIEPTGPPGQGYCPSMCIPTALGVRQP